MPSNLSVAASSTTAPDRLAQQLLNGGRIVLVFAQAQPGVRQAHGVAADGMPFEDEATDEIGLGRQLSAG